MYSFPRPVQSRLPILFGFSMTPVRARQIVELGDGWCASLIGLEEFGAGAALLRETWQAAGRSVATLKLRVTSPTILDADGTVNVEATLHEAARYIDAGATIIALALPKDLPSMAAVDELLSAIGEAVRRHST